MSPGDASLVDACRAGHVEGFDRFFRTYSSYVERVIARLVGPTPDLDDLVQTTFVEAMRSFVNYRGEASLKTWVSRIAVHVTMHQLRRGLRRHVPLELLPEASEPADERAGAFPDRLSDDRQIAFRLHKLLDRVSPKKRVAFLLYTVEGRSIEEVAAMTGAGRAAAKSRIWFARRELLAMARKDPALLELAGLEPQEGARCR